MTCIVGMLDKKTHRVFIGGDSAGISDSSVMIRKDVKVFQNGEFIFGCTTSFRMIQLLQFSFKPPEIKTKNIYEYMCTDFINEVRKCFKEGGYLQKYTDGDEKGGCFLVGYKNRLFKIDNDFQIAENRNGIDATGSGADYALGALVALEKQKISTNDKILNALKVSEFLSTDVRGPFAILNT